MTAWRTLPAAAVTRDRNSDRVTYVVLGDGPLRATSAVHGYAIENPDIGRWFYHRFQPLEKGQTVPHIAVPVGSGVTMAAAIESGLNGPTVVASDG